MMTELMSFTKQIKLKGNKKAVSTVMKSIRGGPFDMWGGGGYGFYLVIKLFFRHPA